MVSHGIVIRQLFRIFFDEFGCTLPDHRFFIENLCPRHQSPITYSNDAHNRLDVENTNWSRFVITVSGDEDHVIKSMYLVSGII